MLASPSRLTILIPLVAANTVAFPLGATVGPAVTIYTRDLGFVREARTLALTGARDTIRLEDLSRALDFTSVRLEPLGPSQVTRLAFRYDVASGDVVLDRARGSRVSVAVGKERVVTGTLVSADGGWLTVAEDSGTLHTLARTAIEGVRVLEPAAEFSLRPALEVVIEGGRRGREEAQLFYLTGGLSWNAEHTVVRIGEADALWSADVTVENHTGRDFVDARLQLVAGEPSRAGAPPMPIAMRAGLMMEAAKAEPDFAEQGFSEYHLYTLGRPATLRDRENQKLSMLEPRKVPIAPRYLYRGGDPRGVRAQIEVENEKSRGLGVPLPAGRVRIYETDPAGDLQFIGESRIGHTAEGEKVTLEVGAAFDLAAERRELYNRRPSPREREYGIEVKLRNHKQTTATIIVEEGVSGDTEITRASHPYERKDAGTIQFRVPVTAGKEVVVSYEARTRY